MLRVTKVSIAQSRATIHIVDDCDLDQEQRDRLSELLKAKHPGILEHTCVNSQGPTFGHCLDSTSLPHILEHMIIEKATHLWHDFKVIGCTRKVDERGYEIGVTYRDDVELLSILNDCIIEFNDMIREAQFSGY